MAETAKERAPDWLHADAEDQAEPFARTATVAPARETTVSSDWLAAFLDDEVPKSQPTNPDDPSRRPMPWNLESNELELSEDMSLTVPPLKEVGKPRRRVTRIGVVLAGLFLLASPGLGLWWTLATPSSQQSMTGTSESPPPQSGPSTLPTPVESGSGLRGEGAVLQPGRTGPDVGAEHTHLGEILPVSGGPVSAQW
jgi:hypothetical protein